MIRYAEVILPLALPQGTLVYSYDEEQQNIVSGIRVIVQLRYKYYTAIVYRILEETPTFACKAIFSVIDSSPILDERHLYCWFWIARYYMCTIGEVMQATLPSMLKLESATLVTLSNDKAPITPETLYSLVSFGNETQKRTAISILELLANGKAYRIEDIVSLVGHTRQVYPVLHKMASSDVLTLKGKLRSSRKNELPKNDLPTNPLPELSCTQQQTVENIEKQFTKFDIVLLFGIAASGKTEIYSWLIHRQVEYGFQVLFLVPEILLTTQLTDRLQSYFGGLVCCYHSKLSDGVRKSIYRDVYEGKISIVLGSRSSLFLPFNKLSLIIVDEEHDSSYKQQDPSPRYNARDFSMILARKFGGKVLLGSATPLLESMYMVQQKKYGFAEIAVRYSSTPLPRVMTVNMKMEKKQDRASYLSSLLQAKIGEKLAAGEQVILFINRRGYAPVVRCSFCHTVRQCPRCSVSLTYHKTGSEELLLCHYCNYTISLSQKCSECGTSSYNFIGTGTEKIEEQLGKLYPLARTARLDLDTTRSGKKMTQLLEQTRQGLVDILVGTQMVVKGVDFHNVTLVGILDADLLFMFPDFRAHERGYQQLVQVAGRSGRGMKVGEVVLQTYVPRHAVIRQAIYREYMEMYEEQLLQREEFGYPPFQRLISITFRHHNSNILNTVSHYFKEYLVSRHYPLLLLGPNPPYINKIKNQYLQMILIKMNRTLPNIEVIKDDIRTLCDNIKQQNKGLSFGIDVDPVQ